METWERAPTLQSTGTRRLAPPHPLKSSFTKSTRRSSQRSRSRFARAFQHVAGLKSTALQTSSKPNAHLDEGNPAEVAVDVVAPQRRRQLAAVDVVGQLRDVFQKDFLRKFQREETVSAGPPTWHLRTAKLRTHLERGGGRGLGLSQQLQQQLERVLLSGLDQVSAVDHLHVLREQTDRRAR